MQTGLWDFSAGGKNQLEESPLESREVWWRTRSAVSHSVALALAQLALNKQIARSYHNA